MQMPPVIQPTQPDAERLPALDLIRGVAILMILPANLPFFAFPDMLTWVTLELNHLERAIAAIVFLFVQGKFITLLSILFGAGMAIQADKYPDGRLFARYYRRRMAFLFLIGLAHVLLLWLGDVLTYYAVTGLVALALIHLSPRAILRIAIASFIWVYLIVALGGVLIASFGDEWRSLQASLSATAPSPASGATTTPQERADDPFARQAEEFFTAESLAQVYREGTLWQRMLYNVLFWAGALCCACWLIIPYILACFFVGVWLQRHGVFADVTAHRPLLRRLIVGGLLVGVPVHLLALRAFWLEPNGLMHWVWIVLGAFALALAYLGVLVLWSHSSALAWLQSRLRAVGRLALSNYILQSLVCGFLFYGWGVGLYGQLSHAGVYAIALPVWLFSLIVSPIWLRHFTIGPVEWLWRSLAEGRRRPFRRREV